MVDYGGLHCVFFCGGQRDAWTMWQAIHCGGQHGRLNKTEVPCMVVNTQDSGGLFGIQHLIAVDALDGYARLLAIHFLDCVALYICGIDKLTIDCGGLCL